MKEISPDPHLRSANKVSGYHIETVDGEIGHLEDFLLDDESWQIRYLIVDTKNWWPCKKVLLRPQWIKSVHWAKREIRANMSREAIYAEPCMEPRLTSQPRIRVASASTLRLRTLLDSG